MKLPKQPLIIFSSLYRENKSVARQNISVLKCADYNLGCLGQAAPTSLTVAVVVVMSAALLGVFGQKDSPKVILRSVIQLYA